MLNYCWWNLAAVLSLPSVGCLLLPEVVREQQCPFFQDLLSSRRSGGGGWNAAGLGCGQPDDLEESDNMMKGLGREDTFSALSRN